MIYIKSVVFRLIVALAGFFLLTPFVILCLLSRFLRKPFDVGLGPEPLINNIYHKRALVAKGYRVQTFVSQVYFITAEFDVRADLIFKNGVSKAFLPYYLFAISVLRYKSIYIYFNGGPLGLTPFWRIEPFFYRLANVKVVVMPYGSDVQDLSRSPNLLFKNAVARDYPRHRLSRKRTVKRIDLWTRHASHVIGGCEWVDYMYYWSTLMLAHFSIDTDAWQPVEEKEKNSTFRIFHAPNHRNIKGTAHFIKAVEELKREGLDVELVMREKVPNTEIKKLIASADMVADQLIMGWYAMFALEAMSMEKPVLCYLREDLKELYTAAGLIEKDEIPIVNCNLFTIKDTIREFVKNRDRLKDIGKRSRQYVVKHHSLDYVGEVFARINSSMGITPGG